MLRRLITVSAASFLVLSSASASAEEFNELSCSKVISDTIKVSVKEEKLFVQWTTRGGEGQMKLLRAAADPRIPSSLLRAYGDLQISFSLPADGCEFSEAHAGKFHCRFEQDGSQKPIRLTVLARVSPYGREKPDLYQVELSAADISTKFSGESGKRYLTFPFRFSVASPAATKIGAESSFFFAHYWQSEGFRQEPSCTIDGRFLVL